jgi:hypothetical protein
MYKTAPRIIMRKLKDALRLKFEGQQANQQIDTTLGISKGVLTKYVGLAIVARLDWLTIAAMDEACLERRLLPAPRHSASHPVKPMRHSMTYDQGREMAMPKELSHNTGIAVYFCDPHSPWQRGSNENMNGLIRQYLPKGTDLSVCSQAQMDGCHRRPNQQPSSQGFGGTVPTGGLHRTAAQQPTTFNAHRLTNAALHFTFESAH